MNKLKVICIKNVKYDNCQFTKNNTYVVEEGDRKVFIFGCSDSIILTKKEYERISSNFIPFIPNIYET